MSLPKTIQLLVPLESKNDKHQQGIRPMWVQSYSKKEANNRDAAALNFKLYNQKNIGTLSVTYKSSAGNEMQTICSGKPQPEAASHLGNRVLQDENRFACKPDAFAEQLLFTKESHINFVKEHTLELSDFKNIDWLNTPGPLYTTNKAIYGSGYVISPYNIANNQMKDQIVFKQPLSKKEADKTLLAIELDDFVGYYFDGNACWNKENIIKWWDKSDERIAAILELYKQELYLPNKSNDVDEDFKRPTPENFKYWLDFYESGMKKYLEWYVYHLEGITIQLPKLSVDWTLKHKLDKILYLQFISKINE